MISASFGVKFASTRASGFEKIDGRCEFLDGQTDRQLFSFIYIDDCGQHKQAKSMV